MSGREAGMADGLWRKAASAAVTGCRGERYASEATQCGACDWGQAGRVQGQGRVVGGCCGAFRHTAWPGWPHLRRS